MVLGYETWLGRYNRACSQAKDRPHQRCVVSIFGSILIRALNEKFNVQYIMAGRAAGERTEIL